MGEKIDMKECFLTKNGPKAIGPYSTAVVSNNMVYLSGMLPLDPATNKLVEGDVEAQTEQAMNNVETVLKEMGLSMAHVVKTTVFMVDLNDFAQVNAIYPKWFASNYPARSCVQVAALPMGALIEVEAIAAMK